MDFKQRYKSVFSQIHPVKDFDPEEIIVNKSTRNITKKLVVAATVAALLAGLCLTAYAVNLFGLRDLLLPERQEVQLPIDPADVEPDGLPLDREQETYMADVISLAGYADTPESRATAEWQAFLASYDPDGEIIDSLGNSIFGAGTSYVYYQVYTQEMADKLDEIAAKYNLKLHTDMLDDLYTGEALCDQVGGDFLGENRAYSAYMYEDGTFKFDGELDLVGYGHLDYQFQRCVRGSFTDILLNIRDINDYAEWGYMTGSGVLVTLALAAHKALVIVDLPDSFVTINVLAGTDTAEGDTFSSGPLDAEDLERFADSFDFSILTPARPADRSLPRPTLDEVLGKPTPEEFFRIAGVGEPEAQAFYAEFFAAVENGERQAVAGMLLYPAAVTTGEGVFTVTDPEEFLPYYDDIFTDSLWISIISNQYDRERADLIPDNGMVGAAGGAIWSAETADGGMGILTIQNAEGASVRHGGAAEAHHESAREAYAAVLEKVLYENTLPDGTVYEPYEPVDTNVFALCDVNGDGAEELVLLIRNTYTAGQAGYVLSWDAEAGRLWTQLMEYPLLTFYDNGYAMAGWSHNQGLAGGSLWPYTLYRYGDVEGLYVAVAQVDAWDRELAETYQGRPFPEEADRSGTGVVYYVMDMGGHDLTDSDPMDAADYEAWVASWQGKELEIPYQGLTADTSLLETTA